jgi:hypothetical protein
MCSPKLQHNQNQADSRTKFDDSLDTKEAIPSTSSPYFSFDAWNEYPERTYSYQTARENEPNGAYYYAARGSSHHYNNHFHDRNYMYHTRSEMMDDVQSRYNYSSGASNRNPEPYLNRQDDRLYSSQQHGLQQRVDYEQSGMFD